MFGKRKRQPIPPYRDPAADPEFQSLPLNRRTLILDRLDRCLEMDRAKVKQDCAGWIAERYEGTDFEGKKRTGLSAKRIYNAWREWVNAGRNWHTLDKYRTLYHPQEKPLQHYNLDQQAVHDYLARHGLTIAQWAASHDLAPASVSRAINGSRPTAQSQRILDILAGELRAEPGHWHQQVATMLQEVAAMQEKLKRLQKQLPPP
ncbi:hypothetical protein OH491_13635 [Termitidicoccus mucosus]|uniref:Uncharacterized protein n=1 Tax=Termitidicoccus mucosus TaxID=1184151 RepID=A0A178IH51_9BACT|nr:hypothetical protein AW736_13815 [Opitutaceae bacterium TSB47]